MSDLNQAIENVRATARVFQSVIDLAAALEGLASIEQAEIDGKARLVRIKAETAKCEIENAKAKAEANEAVAAAEQEAARLLDDANTVAKAVMNAAHQDAETILSTAADQVDQFQQRAFAYQSEEKAALDAVDSAKIELAAVEAKIAEARAKMAEMLGV